jgi:transposase
MYPRELRERAVRLVLETKHEYGSEFEAITSIAKKLNIGSPETLRKWVRRVEIDGGSRPGRTSEELAEIRRRVNFERENAELQRGPQPVEEVAGITTRNGPALSGANCSHPSRCSPALVSG